MKKKLFSHLPKIISVVTIFILCISLSGCSALFAGLVLKSPVQSAAAQHTTALQIGRHDISAVELNYFYIDAITEYVNQYNSYIQYFMDVSKPLNEQVYDTETGKTWADTFLDQAIESAKNTYALYDAAIAAGHTLSESEVSAMTQLYENMDTYAALYGYNDADQYLMAIYGAGATSSSYKLYYQAVVMASSYYAAYAKNLKDSYNDVTLRQFEGNEGYKYNSYSYSTIYLNADKFSSELDLRRAVTILADSDNNTVEKLNAAIRDMEMEMLNVPSSGTFSTVTTQEDTLYSSINSLAQEWISSDLREPGDITCIDYMMDGELMGVYVVLFHGVNDNRFALANVRHILIAYEGGTTNIATGETVYTDEEKQTAREEALKIYQQWLEGPKTEDSFAELARLFTDDSNADQGGLYEDIFPGQMVDSFNHWCFDGRKPGDHIILETEYGWHIMYYSGDSETTYRNYMVANEKLTVDMDAWNKDLNENISCEVKNTSFINKEYIIEPNQIK